MGRSLGRSALCLAEAPLQLFVSLSQYFLERHQRMGKGGRQHWPGKQEQVRAACSDITEIIVTCGETLWEVVCVCVCVCVCVVSGLGFRFRG